MTFGCVSGAVVWVPGDILVCFGCCGASSGLPSGVFWVLWCGFRVTFGCVSGAVVWVPDDLGCVSCAVVQVSGGLRVCVFGRSSVGFG